MAASSNATFALILAATAEEEEVVNERWQQSVQQTMSTLQAAAMAAVDGSVCERTVWRFPTNNFWWENAETTMPDHVFKHTMRMTRETFAVSF